MTEAEKKDVLQEQSSGGLLESAEEAEKHRIERGDPEPVERKASALGRHIDIGGVADFGPVDTERMQQVKEDEK